MTERYVLAGLLVLIMIVAGIAAWWFARRKSVKSRRTRRIDITPGS